LKNKLEQRQTPQRKLLEPSLHQNTVIGFSYEQKIENPIRKIVMSSNSNRSRGHIFLSKQGSIYREQSFIYRERLLLGHAVSCLLPIRTASRAMLLQIRLPTESPKGEEGYWDTGTSDPPLSMCPSQFSVLQPMCRRGPRPGLPPPDALPEVPPPSRTPLSGYPAAAPAAGHPCPGALAAGPEASSAVVTPSRQYKSPAGGGPAAYTAGPGVFLPSLARMNWPDGD
jgi:hypothetical protein